MVRHFNVTGICDPERHYMVDIQPRLAAIRDMVRQGRYFTINRARQYGKTTTLNALEHYLSEEYLVVSMDFQMFSYSAFEREETFVKAFANEILVLCSGIGRLPEDIAERLKEIPGDLRSLFICLSDWCAKSAKPIVLMVDEVDSAANNQVFLDFLAQMRGYYIHRKKRPAFQSVILAGVYDVKNLKRKIGAEDGQKVNSPWNIAADFLLDMSLDADGIEGMLAEYENDYHTGMEIRAIADLIYEYTSGYPYLVSRICMLMDERVAGQDIPAAWTREGFLEAVKLLLAENNTLFDSLMGKLKNSSSLRSTMYSILFGGRGISYSPDNEELEAAMMFGFIRVKDSNVVIANRIFEIRLYNYFLTTDEAQNSKMSKAASRDKNQFVHEGHLDMDLVLEKYVIHFQDIYGQHYEEFDEEEGRKRFLLYIRPIINGVGNYYIEPQTRDERRLDLVIDYNGEQFIVELKIWRGNAYNERGESQLAGYLDAFHCRKGYMLSYNFNQNKKVGIHEIFIGGRSLVEALV